MDWLPITAFVISLLALGLSAVNSWVNYRNRADKQTVWLTLTRAADRREENFGTFLHSYDVEVWTLSNGGEGTVMASDVVLTLADGQTYEFRTVDRLSSNESVLATPVSSLPKEGQGAESGGSPRSLVDLDGATAHARWRGPNGKWRTSPVTVLEAWVEPS